MSESPRQTNPRRIGATELEQLSAYLDNALSPDARSRLEERLAKDPDLRAILEGMDRTRTILRAAPTLIPPRNFTLDPAKFSRKAPWYVRFQVVTLIGALGSAASVALIVLGVLLSGQMASSPTAISASTEVARSLAGSPSAATGRLESTMAAPTSAPAVAALATQRATATLPATAGTEERNAAGVGPFASPTAMLAFSAPVAEPDLTPGVGLMAAPTNPPATQPMQPPVPAPGSSGGASGTAAGEDATSVGQMLPTFVPTSTPLRTSVAIQATPQADMDRSPGAADKAQTTSASDLVLQRTATALSRAESEAATPTATPSATPPPTYTYTPSATPLGGGSPPIVRDALPSILPRLLLVVGLMLLMISVVVLGIGWLRSRS